MNRAFLTLTMGNHESGAKLMEIDFTVKDAAGNDWTLSDHLDSPALITFHRGDF